MKNPRGIKIGLRRNHCVLEKRKYTRGYLKSESLIFGYGPASGKVIFLRTVTLLRSILQAKRNNWVQWAVNLINACSKNREPKPISSEYAHRSKLLTSYFQRPYDSSLAYAVIQPNQPRIKMRWHHWKKLRFIWLRYGCRVHKTLVHYSSNCHRNGFNCRLICSACGRKPTARKQRDQRFYPGWAWK